MPKLYPGSYYNAYTSQVIVTLSSASFGGTTASVNVMAANDGVYIVGAGTVIRN